MLIRCCVADALLKNLRHLRLTFLAVEVYPGQGGRRARRDSTQAFRFKAWRSNAAAPLTNDILLEF